MLYSARFTRHSLTLYYGRHTCECDRWYRSSRDRPWIDVPRGPSVETTAWKPREAFPASNSARCDCHPSRPKILYFRGPPDDFVGQNRKAPAGTRQRKIASHPSSHNFFAVSCWRFRLGARSPRGTSAIFLPGAAGRSSATEVASVGLAIDLYARDVGPQFHGPPVKPEGIR